jgi:hypothetical protein
MAARPPVETDWVQVTALLMIRGGGKCEVRSPVCLGPGLWLLGSNMISRHHRLPRGMGGTTDPAVNTLSRLLIVCGDGTKGCHGWIENLERGAAYELGYLVRRGQAPADVPVVLASGRRVMLDDLGPWYLRPPDGRDYCMDTGAHTA